MDMLFFLIACLGLAETVDLFMGKDFLIFMGKNVRDEDYDLPKVYSVEKWLFAADTIACFILSRGAAFGFQVQIAVIVFLLVTLVIHSWVFNSEKFLNKTGRKHRQQKKEARIAWRNRKK